MERAGPKTGLERSWEFTRSLPLIVLGLLGATALLTIWPYREHETSHEGIAAPRNAPEASSLELSVETADRKELEPGADAAQEPAPPGRSAAAPEPPAAAGVFELLVLSEPAGAPLRDLRVVYSTPSERNPPHSDQGNVTTDARGRARIEAPSGQVVRLHVSETPAHGRMSRSLSPLRPGEERWVELRVPTLALRTFHGSVVDDADGSAIADARVFRVAGAGVPLGHRAPAHEAPKEEPVATSDAGGHFRFEEEATGQAALEVRAEGYTPLGFLSGAAHASLGDARKLRLQRAASLLVTVEGAQGHGGRVVLWPGWVRAGDDGFHDPRRPRWSGELSDAGSCTFDALPAGIPLTAEFHRDGQPLRRAPDLLILEAGESREFIWSLAGTRLGGILRNEQGSPIAWQELWLLRNTRSPRFRCRVLGREDARLAVATARTDDAGEFAIDDVAPGEYWLGPAPVGAGRILAVALPVEVPAGMAEARVELVVPSAHYVSGVVLGPDGRPARGAEVRGASLECWHALEQVITGPDGRFLLGPMPKAAYSLSAQRASLLTALSTRVEAGARDVELHLIPAGSISGRTVDSVSGEPLPATCEVHSGRWSGYVSTSGEHFQMELRPGSYALVATATGDRIGVLHPLVLLSGTALENLEVLLEPGVRLRLRYGGLGHLAGVRVRWMGAPVAYSSIRPGLEVDLLVPAGDLVVELVADSEVLESRVLRAVAGEEQEVVLGG